MKMAKILVTDLFRVPLKQLLVKKISVTSKALGSAFWGSRPRSAVVVQAPFQMLAWRYD